MSPSGTGGASPQTGTLSPPCSAIVAHAFPGGQSFFSRSHFRVQDPVFDDRSRNRQIPAAQSPSESHAAPKGRFFDFLRQPPAVSASAIPTTSSSRVNA
jgi:hypothetical protein